MLYFMLLAFLLVNSSNGRESREVVDFRKQIDTTMKQLTDELQKVLLNPKKWPAELVAMANEPQPRFDFNKMEPVRDKRQAESVIDHTIPVNMIKGMFEGTPILALGEQLQELVASLQRSLAGHREDQTRQATRRPDRVLVDRIAPEA
ncbi:hypothetical protein HDE_07950 [Halotydeus destructor]|nr:hypothetical protein HDE_07950 [Halotydeus destructor]